MNTRPDTHPHRLVDRENQGWYLTSDGAGGFAYGADFGHRSGLENTDLTTLTRERGPWRPVEPITDADEALLRDAFTRAGRKTITTLAAALADVYHQARERGGDSHDYGCRTLTAGRGGSWESAVLLQVAWFGNDLRHGSGKRIDAGARQTFVEVLTRWTSDPERFTEVAETLAAVVSQYADERHGADGWRKVADQWLQPASLARDDFSTCYRLFYSQSEHFDSGLI